ncbi:MAG: DUF5110 domain-containing protein, partial [Crocinitomicaceae bacterium]|nr:DUF5110 domain-containing protein [Crocinitomicaceae bacterium]
RYSTVWSGDESGSWEYIRYHIPTVIGSGLSALNCATGDVDGIFGGSGPTYARDLQWKCFTPVLMTISGWASYGKQPWKRGEPYTSISRDYLKLKMRLTPYMYSYCNQAYETGVPAVRGMVLEFPNDPVTWGTTTQYQFMSGEWFLVAPVYQNSNTRDNIYLPAGKWIDYWDGTTYTGPMTLNAYSAPLEKLPLFVWGGAIIPMYPEMLYDGEKATDTLTLDCYPDNSSAFTMYEDDGVTREHRTGSFAKQTFTLNAPDGGHTITLNIGPSVGNYTGKHLDRDYIVHMNFQAAPDSVTVTGILLPEYTLATQLSTANEGWFFDPSEKSGVIHVKTQSMSTATAFDVLFYFDSTIALGYDSPSPIQQLFTIYPNPSSGKFMITSSENEGNNCQIVVYNMNGRIMKTQHAFFDNGKSTLDLSRLEDGVYLIEISNGTKDRFVRKVIVNSSN